MIVSIIIISAAACNIDGEDGYTTPPSMDVSISYINENGEDLLDPELFQFFNIYYLQRNEETEKFETNEAKETQYSFYYEETSRRFALRIFPNREFIDGQSRTLIESPRDNFDTLRVQGYNEARGSIAERIWYNDELVWETTPDPPRRYFTITKSNL
ncbi:MAG: hypothetical protein ACQEST_02330 [Bacteroidota bacterium]